MTSGRKLARDRVERRPIAAPIPYARNAPHPQRCSDRPARGEHARMGWTNPVLVNEQGGIIAGHARVSLRASFGIADIPTMVASGWSDGQSAPTSSPTTNWRSTPVGRQPPPPRARRPRRMDFDLDPDRLLRRQAGRADGPGHKGLINPDEVPEPPAKPVGVLRGRVAARRHRLVRGDSTTVANIHQALVA